MDIGWIGLGEMGSAMAARLVREGHQLTTSARSARGRDAASRIGATIVGSPARVAEHSEVVFSMLGTPADVEEVHLGPSGVLEALRPGSLIIDMTTSDPGLAQRIAAAASARGAGAIDAPVSGGPGRAADGTLSVMIAGAQADVERATPLISVLGTTLIHAGGCGQGQRLKLVHQVALAGAMLGLTEAYILASRTDLDLDAAFDALTAGILGSDLVRFIWPRLKAGDQSPGFRVSHVHKDLRLAQQMADAASTRLAGVDLVDGLYSRLIDRSGPDLGSQALVLAVDEASRHESGARSQ